MANVSRCLAPTKRSLLAALVVALLSSSQADTEVAGGNCKNGYYLHRDNNASHIGCYKFFETAMNWTAAKSYCQEEGGQLAAVRNQNEQTHLEFLRKRAGFPDSLFWVSGNSLISQTFVWGEPYGESVDFTERWAGRSSIVKTIPRGASFSDSMMTDMVILNGYRAAYAWKVVSGAEEEAFICRKEACAGNKDIDIERGICWELPERNVVAASDAWIAGVVVGVFFFVLIAIAGYGKYNETEWYLTLMKGCRNDQIHIRSSFMGGDTFGLGNARASKHSLNEPRATAISMLPTLKAAGDERPSSGPSKRLSNQAGVPFPAPLPAVDATQQHTKRQSHSRSREERPKSTPKHRNFIEQMSAPPPSIESIAPAATLDKRSRPSFQAPKVSLASATGMGNDFGGITGARNSLKKGSSLEPLKTNKNNGDDSD